MPEVETAAPAVTTTINTGASGTTTQPGASTNGPSGIQNGGGPVVVPANASPSDWTAALNEQQKLYVQNKGFKDPAAALDSYQNLEKLMGAPRERLLKLPESSDAPEWGEIYDKLGRPKNANEYAFAKPEGREANPEFTSWAQKQFHELGLTKVQGEKLAAKWNEYATGDIKKSQEAAVANLAVEKQALKKEWGAAYDQQLKTSLKAAQTFGLGQEEVSKLESALGYSATLKFLASIGSKLGEDSFITGGEGGFNGALTPERAQAEIEELKKDKTFIAKYTGGDRESYKKLERLMRFAHPDMPIEG